MPLALVHGLCSQSLSACGAWMVLGWSNRRDRPGPCLSPAALADQCTRQQGFLPCLLLGCVGEAVLRLRRWRRASGLCSQRHLQLCTLQTMYCVFSTSASGSRKVHAAGLQHVATLPLLEISNPHNRQPATPSPAACQSMQTESRHASFHMGSGSAAD